MFSVFTGSSTVIQWSSPTTGGRVKILIVTIGSAGDVNPFIAVGRALRARGHEVAMIVNPHFARHAREGGFAVFPLGEEVEYLRLLQSIVRLAPLKAGIVVFRTLVDIIPVLVRATE